MESLGLLCDAGADVDAPIGGVVVVDAIRSSSKVGVGSVATSAVVPPFVGCSATNVTDFVGVGASELRTGLVKSEDN
jgi:hypothetical protein